MKMRITLIAVLSSAWLFSLSATAEDCDQLKQGSTLWAGCNNYKAFEAADKDLNDAYRKLTTVLNQPSWGEAKQKLIAAQRAWIVFRDKECEFSQELIGGANHVNQSECMVDMTKERAEYIDGLYESYKHTLTSSSGTAAKDAANH
jgi:uncharacterized protein YecT (DUF1311 family)